MNTIQTIHIKGESHTSLEDLKHEKEIIRRNPYDRIFLEVVENNCSLFSLMKNYKFYFPFILGFHLYMKLANIFYVDKKSLIEEAEKRNISLKKIGETIGKMVEMIDSVLYGVYLSLAVLLGAFFSLLILATPLHPLVRIFLLALFAALFFPFVFAINMHEISSKREMHMALEILTTARGRNLVICGERHSRNIGKMLKSPDRSIKFYSSRKRIFPI